MGRTVPTFRDLLDRLENDWRDYRRGLTMEEQRLFDALFQKARAHASASSQAARSEPMEAVFLSMLLEHEKELASLRQRSALLGSASQEPRRSAETRGAIAETEGPSSPKASASTPHPPRHSAVPGGWRQSD